MNDEQQGETSSPVTEDDRFEVKWRKRNEPAPRPDVPEEQAPTADLSELERQLEEERRRTRDLQDRWQRAAADLVNLRKRTEQEQEEREKFASMVLVYELLPALDNFERALASIPGNLSMLTWIQGVMLIQRQIQAILEQRGLQPIQADGQPFNPALHEAVSDRETSDVPAGTVVQEYQRGYTMHGRVIRPTLVEVAKAPVSSQETPEDSGTGRDTGFDEQTGSTQTDDVFIADPESAEEQISVDIADQSEEQNVGP